MSDTITLSRAEYQDLIDVRDAALAMRDVASGVMPVLSEAEVDAYLAAPTPLAFWRKQRGLTQAALAAQLGVSQPYLAQIERGHRGGDVVLYSKMAAALKVRIEDLVPEAVQIIGTQEVRPIDAVVEHARAERARNTAAKRSV
jgi:transcriptional regulator with XRE-family HTH domain